MIWNQNEADDRPLIENNSKANLYEETLIYNLGPAVGGGGLVTGGED